MKAAIFDMDGTLLDSMWMWDKVFPEFLHEQNIIINQEFISKTCNFGMYKMAQYIAQNYFINKTGQQLWEGWADVVTHYYITQVKTKPFVMQYLEQLRRDNVKIAVATLTEHLMCDKALEYHNITPYCECILTTEDVGGVSKHRPDLFLRAAELMGVRAEDCMVFEDSAYAAVPALEAGFKVCGVKDGCQSDKIASLKSSSTIFIESWEELLDKQVAVI